MGNGRGGGDEEDAGGDAGSEATAADDKRNLIRSDVVTCRYAQRLAKYLMDKSLAAGIAAGVDFERSVYDDHRMCRQPRVYHIVVVTLLRHIFIYSCTFLKY